MIFIVCILIRLFYLQIQVQDSHCNSEKYNVAFIYLYVKLFIYLFVKVFVQNFPCILILDFSCLQEKCHQYWPSERSARYQCFVVDPIAEYNMPQYILREFKVTDARDGQSRTVRQFQFIDWPEQGVPKSGEGFIDFIGQVHKTKEQFGQDGPISVHCRLVSSRLRLRLFKESRVELMQEGEK